MGRRFIITNSQIAQFVSRHRLPDTFHRLIDKYYLQLAAWISERRRPDETLIVGISGAQGAGKSTLADFLQLAPGQTLRLPRFDKAEDDRADATGRVDNEYWRESGQVEAIERFQRLTRSCDLAGGIVRVDRQSSGRFPPAALEMRNATGVRDSRCDLPGEILSSYA